LTIIGMAFLALYFEVSKGDLDGETVTGGDRSPFCKIM
jgi:hypothetical protein